MPHVEVRISFAIQKGKQLPLLSFLHNVLTYMFIPHSYPSRSHCHSPAPPTLWPFTILSHSPPCPSDTEGELPITTVAKEETGNVPTSQEGVCFTPGEEE